VRHHGLPGGCLSTVADDLVDDDQVGRRLALGEVDFWFLAVGHDDSFRRQAL
jgi:hypothetical protein